MKNTYQKPSLEFVSFTATDILLTSTDPTEPTRSRSNLVETDYSAGSLDYNNVFGE